MNKGNVLCMNYPFMASCKLHMASVSREGPCSLDLAHDVIDSDPGEIWQVPLLLISSVSHLTSIYPLRVHRACQLVQGKHHSQLRNQSDLLLPQHYHLSLPRARMAACCPFQNKSGPVNPCRMILISSASCLPLDVAEAR